MRLLLAGAVVALWLAGWVAMASIRRLEHAHSESVAAYSRLVQLNRVVDLLIDEETGSRGFILTGDSAFLAPYLRAQGALEVQLARTLASYSSGAGPDAALEELAHLVERRTKHTDSTVALRGWSFVAARDAVASGRGRILMDSVRERAQAVSERERRVVERAARELDRWLDRSIAAIGAGGALALLLLVTAASVARQRRRARDVAAAEVLRLNASLESAVTVTRRELRASEQRLTESLDRLMEGCALLDVDLRYVYANPAAVRQARQPAEQLIGRTFLEAFPGARDGEVHRLMLEVVDTGVSSEREVEFEFEDGARAWFRISVEPVPTGIFVLSVEISEERRTRDALAEREARLRALLSGLPECVAILDDRGRILDVHLPPATDLTSLEPGRLLLEAFGPDAAVDLEKALQLARVSPGAVFHELRLDDGAARRDYELAIVWDHQSGNRFCVVARNITTRRSLEAQLRQAQKMEAVGQLTGGIAHDFNNILTVIGATAELLTARVTDDTVKEDLAQILHAKQKGAAMVAQLLGFSRRGMLARESLAPAAIVQQFSGMLRRLLPVAIRLELDVPDASGVTRLDVGALEQMLANLVTNARDAMPDGGVIRIECRREYLDSGYHATHPWVKPGAYVCISVSDSGQGMPDAVRQRVFEPFFTTKPVGKGSGLGLAMVYGMMKEHEGMVHIYSEPGKGTIVRLYFPVVEGTESTQAVRHNSDPAVVAGGSETILFVEDEPFIRMAARRALESKGYVVREAVDGEQALQLLATDGDGIDLVVTDLVMPNLGGRQLLEAMRASGRQLPILFTSGYSAEAFYREAQLPTGTRFLHKPWSLADLFRAVRDCLDASGG
jgi:two-component system, cell cycle sensor histidine kinase and response regulator CckA